MTFAERLKTLRHDKKLTQLQLASLLQIRRGTYVHYELGKREPDLDTVVQIARFYGVSTDFLLGITDFPETTESLIRYYRKSQIEYPLIESSVRRVSELD